MIKVNKIQKYELQDVKLEITINVDEPKCCKILLKFRCSKCDGYGCPSGCKTDDIQIEIKSKKIKNSQIQNPASRI